MSLTTDYSKYIESFPNFPKPGVLFRDVFPLISNIKIFKQSIKDLALVSRILKPKKILSIEARGFIIGTALSIEMDIPMLPARKIGKLPGETISHSYSLEYGTDTMQIPKTAIEEGERVLLADDVLATGGTAKAAITLIEIAKGIPIGLASLIELSFLNGRKTLESNDFKIYSLVNYTK